MSRWMIPYDLKESECSIENKHWHSLKSESDEREVPVCEDKRGRWEFEQQVEQQEEEEIHHSLSEEQQENHNPHIWT